MASAKNNFFILSAPRCGSTVLARSLDKHPQIFCAGELFHPSEKIYHAEWHFNFWGRKKKKGFSRTIFSAVNFVNGYLFAAHHLKKFYNQKNQKKICGFKLMIGQVKDFPTVLNYLQKENIKVIVLVRKNIFREALSSLRAKQTGVFHSHKISTATKKVYVNTALLKKRIEELENLHALIFRLTENMQRIVLMYEEFSNWNNVLNKVFNFLQVEQIEIEPVLYKLSTENWRSEVENYTEIEAMLNDKYAHYL